MLRRHPSLRGARRHGGRGPETWTQAQAAHLLFPGLPGSLDVNVHSPTHCGPSTWTFCAGGRGSPQTREPGAGGQLGDDPDARFTPTSSICHLSLITYRLSAICLSTSLFLIFCRSNPWGALGRGEGISAFAPGAAGCLRGVAPV